MFIEMTNDLGIKELINTDNITKIVGLNKQVTRVLFVGDSLISDINMPFEEFKSSFFKCCSDDITFRRIN